jgi:predicted membrane metal-binding protein
MATSKVSEKLSEVLTHVENYLEARLSLLKLDLAEKSAKMMSLMIGLLILGFLLTTTFLFFLISIALLLGEILGSYSLSFGLITLFMLVLVVFLILFRNKLIESPIANTIIRKLYE